MKLTHKDIVPYAGAVGLLLLVAGYVRYTVAGELEIASKILLIAGGALVLAWVALGFRGIIAFFSKRSSKMGANTGVLIIAVVAILVFINYLGYRHHKTFDLTSEKLYTLSDQTRKIIDPIRTNVQVFMFDRASGSDGQQVQAMKDQMAEYAAENPHIQFTLIDPQEHPELAKKYDVARIGQAIVVNGSKIERLEENTEQDITSAILKAISTTVKTVCFVEGHGEKSTSGTDENGLSDVATELGKENYQLKTINLVTSGNVPSDCSALVDAGPTKSFFPQEAEMIQKYLQGGGKAMFLLDPGMDPKLDAIMQPWNVKVGSDYVIDISGVGRLIGMGPAIPLVVNYGQSPIVRNFENSMTFFPLARTVTVADKSKTAPETIELLKTSAASFTVASLGNGTVKYDPKKDQRGPLSLGVAAENGSGKSDARLVVIGNSEFAANRWIDQQRNGDLFFNAVNWLTHEGNLISIRPKQAANRRVTLTQSQQRGLAWGSEIFLPLLVIAAGVVIWLKRR